MPSTDKPRLNVVVGPKLHSDIQRVAQQRETTIAEVTRQAVRREIRKDLPTINRAMPRGKEQS